MKTIKLYNDLEASQVALGCMRISEKSIDELEVLVKTALDTGINFFDHADIYGGGKSEELFGEVLKQNPSLRDQMIIQTKCGIRNGYYDFSKEHILKSVEDSLTRLQTDHVEVLLLHRPDTLMEPEVVAEAFDELHKAGKVHHFGVSNMNPLQMELLQKYTKHPLLINQVQFNPVNATMIDAGFHVNMRDQEAIMRDGGLLEYARIHNITLQPWSILQASWAEGCFLSNEAYQSLTDTLTSIGERYGVDAAAMNLAWILRHPANMQPIAGTSNPEHLISICKGADLSITREEWYEIYRSVGKMMP